MKRFALLSSLVLAVSAVAVPAHAVPAPDAGGPAELLRYVGDPASGTGSALANGQCDVNGDDHDDAVGGAWFWDKAPVNSLGAAYVLLGGEHATGGSLADPADAGAVRIDGPDVAPPVPPSTTVNGTAAGFAVACVGDVNGDGFDDIAISDYDLQRAYIVFGAKNFTALSLSSLGSRGFIVQAPLATAGNFSFSLAPVGDVNSDGLADFAVAEVGADTRGRTNNGRVWVLAGRDDVSDVDVAAPEPGQVIATVDGALTSERLGQIASAGDVNGDGLDDFVLGSYTSTPWGTAVAATGAAYVVFGGSTGEIDLASLGNQGFTILGPKRQRDRLGISVSAAGDVDSDGKADLLIGADGVSNATTGPRSGGAAVVLGSASTAPVYTDPVVSGAQSVYTCGDGSAGTCAVQTRRGYWINGAVNGDSAGYSVAGIGDVNADGVPDFALGAYGHDPVDPADPAVTMSGAGAVYVVFGRTSGTIRELATLTASTGYRIDGLTAGDRFGRQVGLIGDFDGNGSRDVVAGADFANRTAAGAANGEVAVALMGRLKADVSVSVPSSIAPGQAATLAATVTKRAGDQSLIDQGTVTFRSDGVPIAGCKQIPLVGGDALCTTSWQDRSAPKVTAVFSGTSTLTAASSAVTTVSVEATAVVDPDRSPTFTYGTTPDALTGEIRGDVPTGTVEVRDGATVLGRADLEHGDFSVALGATALAPGAHTLTLAYAGDRRNGAAERAVAVTVDKASPRVSVTRSRSVLKGKRRLTLTIRATARGVVPTGTVRIMVGSKTVKTVKLSKGRARYTLPRLAKGAQKLSVVYAGSTTVGSKTIRVKKVVQK